MPTVSLEISDDNVTRLLEGVTPHFERLEGESDLAYGKRWIIRIIIERLQGYEQLNASSGVEAASSDLIT